MRKLPTRKRMELLRSWRLKNKILPDDAIPAYAHEGIPRREEVVLNGIIPEPLRCGEVDLCRADAEGLFAALSCRESLYDLPQFFKYRSLFCKA